ncbi:unnamed protein product [Musa acuminata subsp. burmannicoides]
MGDVQVPLRLSAPYFICAATAASEERIHCSTSRASPLTLAVALCKPPRKLIKLFSSSKQRRKAHAGGRRWWCFFAKSKASEKIRFGSGSSPVDGEEDDTGSSSACQERSPKEPSPPSSISPTSVLEKKLYVDGDSNEDDDGVKKTIRFDSSESSISRNVSRKLQREVSSNVFDESTRDGKAFESVASTRVPLSSLLVYTIDESLEEEKDGTESHNSETSSCDGNTSTSLRPNAPSDILKTEAGDVTQQNVATSDSDEEAEQYEKLEMETEIAQVSRTSKEIQAYEALPGNGDDPYLVMRLPERTSSAPFDLLKTKMLHGMHTSRGLSSMALRFSAASRLSRKKQQRSDECAGDELWSKKILMGKRCQEPTADDCHSLDDGVELWKKKITAGKQCQELTLWVLIQFGAFIVLCGATHLINLWTFTVHSKTLAIVMTIAKVSTAVVSCATALMLVHIIPDLLSVKTRELFLKNKAEELDREMGLIRTQEETGRHVRMLTHEIRSTLDRDTILKTTLVELGRTLGLEECALWMPSRNGSSLYLSRTLHHQLPTGSTVPINLPVVNQIFSSNHAMIIPHTCQLAKIRPSSGRYVPPEVAAVRVPLLHLSNFQINDWSELSAKSYAVMVLILPSDSARKWHVHELELVEVVADQVAVALSHAAILEESMRARDLLMEQNVALDYARQEAELAIRARNDFLAVMNHEMRTPLHAIITLSSLLLETELNPEQRSMVETVLKSSSLLATLINDILDLSKLEDGSLELEIGTFNLHSVFREVVNFIKPIAAVKKLSVSLMLSPDLPLCAIGDEKRLMQILLNIVGNAVKFTKEGHISLTASVARADYLRDFRASEFYPVSSDGQFYLRVQVKDTGCGISSQDLPHLFTKFAHGRNVASRGFSGSGLGLAICKRYVSLMQGHIWLESEGIGKGCMATFVVKLGICENPDGSQQKIVLLPWTKHGQEDTSSSRGMPKDPKAFIPLKPRYQRSV